MDDGLSCLLSRLAIYGDNLNKKSPKLVALGNVWFAENLTLVRCCCPVRRALPL